MNLLIADDSHEIRRILSDYAAKEGYHITTASDGEEALLQFERQSIDVVLLDVMMPKLDGYEVCRQIRQTSNIPIIMITARGEDYERIMGLDIGADDYMVKPFSPGEVMARIRAVMRRIEKTPANTRSMSELVLDNLKICLEENKVWINDTFIELTKKELELLWTLAFHKGMVFTRDHLIDSLWGYDYYGDTRTVDSHIKRLRAKLDEVPHPAWEIKTVWGKGYKLEVTDAS